MSSSSAQAPDPPSPTSPPPIPPLSATSFPNRVDSSGSILLGEAFADIDNVETDEAPIPQPNRVTNRESLNSRRPPLRPTETSPKQQQQQPQSPGTKPLSLHDRGVSQGEMSALTDPMVEMTLSDMEQPFDEKRPFRHLRDSRAVSWGMQVKPGSLEPHSILQPFLNDSRNRMDAPFLQPRVASAEENRSARLLKKLSMTNVVDPIECEAETAIMEAIESREKESMQRRQSTANMILPNMTMDAVAKWQSLVQTDETAVQPQQGDDATKNLLDTSTTTPIVEQTNKAPSLEPSPSKDTVSGVNKKKPQPVSKRTTTVSSMETTLSQLATKMRTIHQAESNANQGDEINMVTDQDPKGSKTSTSTQSSKTQYDSLAKDAARLFRGVTSGSVKPSAPADDPKKNDDLENGAHEIPSVSLGSSQTRQKSKLFNGTMNAAKEGWESVFDHFRAQRTTFAFYAKAVLFYVILPATAISALLFYLFSNPLMAVGQHPVTKQYPSVSWFILFLCVRQTITFSMARFTEFVLVELMALKTGLMIRVLGPLITLVVVQSKGWPFTLTWWGFYDLCMLSGDGPFANHWMFYQNFIALFSEQNPSGNITDNEWNFRIIIVAVVIGIVVTLKRFAVGLYLGGRQYSSYGAKLAVVVHNMLIITDVARLARKLEAGGSERYSQREGVDGGVSDIQWKFSSFDELADENGNNLNDQGQPSPEGTKENEETQDRAVYSRVLSSSEKFRIANMLESWEEPQEDKIVDSISIGGILQFKQSLAFMDLVYPFSKAFGRAESRDDCVQSAQEVFNCLVGSIGTDPDKLHFETLSSLAKDPNTGNFDEKKLKDLVKVFRPERDGTLCMLEFVRSIDRVYKDLRLLRASIRNSACLDTALESIIDIGFYFLMFCFVLIGWHIDPLQIFLSLSSVILAFTFAIGSASAKYFEGLMFIILRNPYDIGDRISIDGPNDKPGMDGHFTWFVEDVKLDHTKVRLGATNECATIANFSLANSRIVNAARSHKAVVYVNLKFGVYVPYKNIQIFKEAVIDFVKGRPREWLSCSGIRATRVELDLGYVAYTVVLQHRDSWQHLGVILESRAAVMNFCLEVQKKLGMRYVAPPTPVDLSIKSSLLSPSNVASESEQERNRTELEDIQGVSNMFEGSAGS